MCINLQQLKCEKTKTISAGFWTTLPVCDNLVPAHPQLKPNTAQMERCVHAVSHARHHRVMSLGKRNTYRMRKKTANCIDGDRPILRMSISAAAVRRGCGLRCRKKLKAKEIDIIRTSKSAVIVGEKLTL